MRGLLSPLTHGFMKKMRMLKNKSILTALLIDIQPCIIIPAIIYYNWKERGRESIGHIKQSSINKKSIRYYRKQELSLNRMKKSRKKSDWRKWRNLAKIFSKILSEFMSRTRQSTKMKNWIF